MTEGKTKEENSNNQEQAGNNNQSQKEVEEAEAKKTEIEKKLEELEQEVSEEDTQFASLEDELVNAKEEIDELKEKKEKYQSRLKHLKADFANYKRRQREQRDKLILRTKRDLLKELIPVIDNFERAIDSCKAESDGLVEGVNMIYKQLNQFLAAEDVKQLGEKGEEFDPNCHNAVAREESEEYESDKILEVLQTGYQIEDEIIRPAMVKVVE